MKSNVTGDCVDREKSEDAVTACSSTVASQLRVLLAGLVSAVGAFLFGLDIGYIAPILECKAFKRDVAHLPNWNDPTSTISSVNSGFLVGVFSIGCILSSFPVISSYFLDGWGRRSSISLGASVFLLAVVLQATAASILQMIVGRFIAGLSIGLLSTVVTLYQGEIAPPDMRGTLTSLYQFMIAFGILVAAFVDMMVVQKDEGWRLAVWLQAIPSGLLLVSMRCLPRSPRWLVSTGRTEEAFEVLKGFRSSTDLARQEFDEIVANHAAAEALGEPRWADVFSGRMKKLIVLGMLLQMLQQLVGMNAIMYFGPRIFRRLGLRMNLFQTFTNAINFLATFPAIYLADRCGRRALLLWGAAGMTISCAVMSVVGIVFMSDSDEQEEDTDTSTLRKAAGLMVAFSVFFFVVNFAYSWGPMVWVYCAEIFPLKYRSRGVGLTAMANWSGNYMIAQFTPWLLQHLGFGTFILFGVCSLLSFRLAFWLPETKGVPLEQIDCLFDAKFGLEATRVPSRTDEEDGLELALSTNRSAAPRQEDQENSVHEV